MQGNDRLYFTILKSVEREWIAQVREGSGGSFRSSAKRGGGLD